MDKCIVHMDVSPQILLGVSDAARLLGQYEGRSCAISPHVKRENFVRNLHANLALEGNTLSVAEVQSLRNGHDVGAMKDELQQANGFLTVYRKSDHFKVTHSKDLLTAFLLMNEEQPFYPKMSEDSAIIWNARMKESLEKVNWLFRCVEQNEQQHPFIVAAQFHYHMFHLQPFSRYSDALARLWHRLLLARYHHVFFDAPFELLIKQNRQRYTDALGTADTAEGLQRFVTFTLECIGESLEIVLDGLDMRSQRTDDRLAFAKMHFGTEKLTRKKYMELFRNIGPATASRDLKAGLDSGILTKQGEKARTEYCFVAAAIRK
ncbi:MAG: hypothetical protein JXR76_19615 [Deltaproteobacteria bacterium]|nr:hypothetical protein [Deltaproteobacteria bacterium]